MKNWIWVVLAIVILIGVIYVINQCSQPDLPTEVPPNDTLYVYGDTLWLPSDTVWTVKWKKIPAVTTIDTTGMVTKSAIKDTLLVMDKDSIRIEANAIYYPPEDIFDINLDVDYRRYESLRVDTMKVNNYVPVEVEVTDPMWMIIAIAEFVLFVGAGILIIIGG